MEQISCPPRRFHYIYNLRRKTIFDDETSARRKSEEEEVIAMPTKGGSFAAPNAFEEQPESSLKLASQ